MRFPVMTRRPLSTLFMRQHFTQKKNKIEESSVSSEWVSIKEFEATAPKYLYHILFLLTKRGPYPTSFYGWGGWFVCSLRAFNLSIISSCNFYSRQFDMADLIKMNLNTSYFYSEINGAPAKQWSSWVEDKESSCDASHRSSHSSSCFLNMTNLRAVEYGDVKGCTGDHKSTQLYSGCIWSGYSYLHIVY